MLSFTITFPTLPNLHGRNLNSRGASIGAVRAAHAKNAAVKDEAIATIRSQVQLPLQPLVQARIDLMFWMPTLRDMDVDNLEASCKYYVDALVAVGLLQSDSWRCVPQKSSKAMLRRGKPGFSMTVTELPLPEWHGRKT